MPEKKTLANCKAALSASNFSSPSAQAHKRI